MLNVDEAWDLYLQGKYDPSPTRTGSGHELGRGIGERPAGLLGTETPTPARLCSELYISTKTKISYLNGRVPLESVFWGVPISPYCLPAEGVVKKQMKFNCSDPESLAQLAAAIKIEATKAPNMIDEYVISHIENPGGRIPFRDVRKISIGLCRKDVTSYRCKKKSAFYNCFVVILRLKWQGRYKEIHVKVFNTGKLEIPGIQDDRMLEAALELLTKTMRPLMPAESPPLAHLPDKSETVLINSNFTCNYLIDRERLVEVLRRNYGISSSYDPCSYPGIQCEFYYDPTKDVQVGRKDANYDPTPQPKISFMVFRTGSVLIVGKCSEQILVQIYEFLKALLVAERPAICSGPPPSGPSPSAPTAVSSQAGPALRSERKARKRTITVVVPEQAS